MKVSKKFIATIKLHEKPAYIIAQEAGVDPNLLSKLIHGIVDIKSHEKRVLEVGKLLGLKPYECFESENHKERIQDERF